MTGAGSGIGACVARGCSSAATTCVLVARDEARAREPSGVRRGDAPWSPTSPTPPRSRRSTSPARSTRWCTPPGSWPSAPSASCRPATGAPSSTSTCSPRPSSPGSRCRRCGPPAARWCSSTPGPACAPTPAGRRTPRRSSGCAPSPTPCGRRRSRARRPGHHRPPRPHRHADAGAGARPGGQGRTTPTHWIHPATVAAAVLHVLDLPRDATDPRRHGQPRPDTAPDRGRPTDESGRSTGSDSGCRLPTTRGG